MPEIEKKSRLGSKLKAQREAKLQTQMVDPEGSPLKRKPPREKSMDERLVENSATVMAQILEPIHNDVRSATQELSMIKARLHYLESQNSGWVKWTVGAAVVSAAVGAGVGIAYANHKICKKQA